MKNPYFIDRSIEAYKKADSVNDYIIEKAREGREERIAKQAICEHVFGTPYQSGREMWHTCRNCDKAIRFGPLPPKV